MNDTPNSGDGITPFPVLYCDSRWGTGNRLTVGYPDEEDVRIHDLLKNTVGYIVMRDKTMVREIGTAFFVTVPATSVEGMTFPYIVAAKHVVFDDNNQPLTNLHLRTNQVHGDKLDIPLRARWYCSENEDADIAIMGFGGVPKDLLDIFYLPYRPEGDDLAKGDFTTFADIRTIREMNIGIGDEVRVLGLYTMQSGHRRIEPIVRAGILSAMPNEPVSVRKEGNTATFNAYLVEVRSLGGLSGSPVFVLVEHHRIPVPKGMRILAGDNEYRLFLLGMIRGRHNYRTSNIQSVVQADRKEFSDGLAYVTPIQDVASLLYSDLMKKERNKAEEDYLQAQDEHIGFSEDSAKPSPLTRGGFEEILRDASRKVSQRESGKKETSE